MSKTKSKKLKIVKKRGGSPPLAEIVSKLKKKAGSKGSALAEKLVKANAPEVIALAYRLLPKIQVGLTKAQNETYEELKKISTKEAEMYKADKLAGRSAKANGKYQKKLAS